MTYFKELPSLDVLKATFRYEPETGLFWWLEAGQGRRLSVPAGNLRRNGYYCLKVNYEKYMAHRVAWYMGTGIDPDKRQIDHINGIRSDNRLSNLRLATPASNCWNAGPSSRSTSGVKGVSWLKKERKWVARISCRRQRITIGYYNSIEDAHAAYTRAAQELHGEFARDLTGYGSAMIAQPVLSPSTFHLAPQFLRE
jgi:hypothetical protein